MIERSRDENYFLILRIAEEILLSFLAAVLSLKTFFVTPRISSGSNALKASRALFSSLALMASSTFLMKLLIRFFLAELITFFDALERRAFFAAEVLAIFSSFLVGKNFYEAAENMNAIEFSKKFSPSLRYSQSKPWEPLSSHLRFDNFP